MITIEDNTLNGSGERTTVTIPATVILANSFKDITINYPTSFYDANSSGYDYIIEGYNWIGTNAMPKTFETND